MPSYELFGLAKPFLQRGQHADILRASAKAVFAGGGVLTDLKSFGDRETAYTIRSPGDGHDVAFMWQMSFQSSPSTLAALENGLRLNESMLRWIVHKRRVFRSLPTTYAIARTANESIRAKQMEALLAARQAGTPLWWDPERLQDGKLKLQDPGTGAETTFDVEAPPLHHKRSPVFDSSMQWLAEQDTSSALESGEQSAETVESDTAAEAVQPPAGSFPNPVPAEAAVAEQPDTKDDK